MKRVLEILGLLLLLICAVLLAKQLNAQTVPTNAQPGAETAIAANPKVDVVAMVVREFGDTYKIDPTVAPLFGDFDGDHKQDVVIVATGDNPLMGEPVYHYKTLDPFNASFGYGNPKITMTFNANDTAPRYLLVIHNWQSPTKKFVLVNIPFKEVRMGHMLLKKKAVDAVESIDGAGVQGAIYWDGRKYKWEIIGSEADK